MTERLSDYQNHERREDPELRDISDRLGVIAGVLGFEETDSIAEARAAFVDVVERDDGYDPDRPEHSALLSVYYGAAEERLAGDPESEATLGFELALLRLWLDCGDPYEFRSQLDRDGQGVVEMLGGTPGHTAHLIELLAIVDDLEALKHNDFPAPKHRKPKVGF